MGALAIGHVSYGTWMKFIWKLLLILTVLTMACLILGAVL